MNYLAMLFGLFVAVAVYFALAWCLRPRSPWRAVDQARVDREMWQELDRLRAVSAGKQPRAPLARVPEGAGEGTGSPPAPRQLGRAHIRVVNPPRGNWTPWDGKTH